jgi:hypothetical protein
VFARHAGLDPASSVNISEIKFWIPAFAGMTFRYLSNIQNQALRAQ